MAKLIYNSDSDINREASTIEFTISEDLNIYEFRTVCIRMASAMGYTNTSIKKAFGDEEYESDEDKEFKYFMKELLFGTTITTGSFQTT